MLTEQQIVDLKTSAENARDAYPSVAWFTVSDLQRTRVALSVVCSEHIAKASPESVLALIALVEQQGREVWLKAVETVASMPVDNTVPNFTRAAAFKAEAIALLKEKANEHTVETKAVR